MDTIDWQEHQKTMPDEAEEEIIRCDLCESALSYWEVNNIGDLCSQCHKAEGGRKHQTKPQKV